MTTVKNDTGSTYTPQALHNAFSNSLSSPLLSKVFMIKGVYRAGKGMNYNGYYYDAIKDEFSEYTITFVVPELLRDKLKNDQLVEANVFLSKRNQPNVARIDLVLTVNEIFSSSDRSIPDVDFKRLELIRKKADIGFKDVDNYIRSKFYREQPVNVTVLVGLTAIVDQDILNQMREASAAYNISFIRINLSQVSEILKALENHQLEDMLVIARGGGENIQLFDHPAVSEQALSHKGVLVSALGHSTDQPLLEKIVDKSFITPTAFGQYLHDIYYNTTESYNQSKAKMIEDLSKQIALNYETQLLDMGKRLEASNTSLQQLSRSAKEENEALRVKLAQSKANIKIMVVVLVFLILMAVLLIRLL